MFLNHLYGGMDEPELKIIDVFICKLRKKLSLACGGANYIETVWGRGYVLRDAEDDADTEPQAAVAEDYTGATGEGGAARLRLFRLGVDEEAPPGTPGRQDQWVILAEFGLGLVHPPPTVAAEPLQGPEAGLVGHPVGAFDPIAEIDVGQAGPRRADDVVEDDVGAEALPGRRADVVKAVNHRQSVGRRRPDGLGGRPLKAPDIR
jgi:hypothetical protein